MSIFVVSGQTAPIDYQCKADGANYNLTGCTVTIDAVKLSGAAAPFHGDAVDITDAAAGKVRWTPGDTSDLASADSMYRIRFKVVRGDGKIEYFPNIQREDWIVQQ